MVKNSQVINNIQVYNRIHTNDRWNPTIDFFYTSYRFQKRNPCHNDKCILPPINHHYTQCWKFLALTQELKPITFQLNTNCLSQYVPQSLGRANQRDEDKKRQGMFSTLFLLSLLSSWNQGPLIIYRIKIIGFA